MKTVLICTVGGSHEPIVKAIRELRPDYVCFVCSEDDPVTKKRGSYSQILDPRIPTRSGETLPNIPTQAGLASDRFEVLRALADDFDDIYRKVTAWLEGRDRKEECLVADYTGGTKTMSAALAVAALDAGIELQLVTGGRDNLIQVRSGHEQVLPASVEETRFHRQLKQALSAWRRFAYDEAEVLIEQIPSPRSSELRGLQNRALVLSRAFSRWDRFDHLGAIALLEGYERFLEPDLLAFLRTLTREGPKREPAKILDLWRSAWRRAAQGRYDDAIARLYRLTEWTAQWLLRQNVGIETSDIPKDKIPPEMSLSPNREGKYQAGLFQAWELVAHHLKDDFGAWWREQRSKLLDLLQRRNRSILAHGFEPLSEQDWRDFSNWVEEHLLPLLKAPFRRLPPQLPTDL